MYIPKAIIATLSLALLLGARAQSQEELRPGLVASYSDGKHRVRLVTASPNFHLRAEESVHPALAAAFDVEWTGLLSVVQAGEYTFDGGAAEIYINGRKTTNQPVRLNAGRHPVRIRYHRPAGTATLLVRWKAGHFPLEPIPGSVFSHASAEAQDVVEERGRFLVEERGCTNCHSTGSPSLRGRLGPDLTGIGSWVNAAWLDHWLEDPTAFRSGAMMPAQLDDQQRRDVASYLASLRESVAPRRVRKTSGPDVAQGDRLYGALGCAACHQEKGLELDGLGSKATIPALAEYLKDPAKLDPGGRMPSMLLSDAEALQLAAFLAESRNPDFERAGTPGDPARGKALVASQGCLACHALQGQSNTLRAPRLESLSSARGCLSADSPKGVPRYRFVSGEREAIQTFLAGYKAHPDISPAPVYDLGKSLRQLRCVACHQLDSLGPTATLAEGAPPLTDAGAKLRTGWIEQVTTGRRRVRSWLDLRMPAYDPRHAGPLAAEFAQAAGVEPGDGPAPPPATDAQRARGGGMIGADAKQGGVACVGCHDWGAYKSGGEPGPQLIDATQRLRYDWYVQWMLNPARILSGTSMPNYFGSMERRRADEAIHSLWAALSLGERMPLPAGLGKLTSADPEAKPVPDREAIVIRWDMPEATPAAIADGMTGGISYCFDAGESRLRYAWRGGFVDMTETLTRKTDPNHLTPTAKLI
ncbi:MAG: c-type cytochrome, partial [Acidobacteria bacterium]|nr:c-type cytochrome [Acidobacteriota bacterium]